jgi:hypothetical protein
MRRTLISVAVVAAAALAGCSPAERRPEETRAEANELRNNHARAVADVAERDLRLRELARADKANATLAELEKAIAADRAEVDYLLSVYDDPHSPADFEIEKNSVRRLEHLRDELHRAGAAETPAPAPKKPAAPAKR